MDQKKNISNVENIIGEVENYAMDVSKIIEIYEQDKTEKDVS